MRNYPLKVLEELTKKTMSLSKDTIEEYHELLDEVLQHAKGVTDALKDLKFVEKCFDDECEYLRGANLALEKFKSEMDSELALELKRMCAHND